MAAGFGPTNSMTKSSRDSSSGSPLFLVEVGVVESDLDRGTLLGQFVERHAHLVECLAEVFVAGHGPADLEHVLLLLEANAGLFFIGAGGAVGQRLGAGIFPERRERLLDLIEAHIGTQRHVAVYVDFEWSVIARHVLLPCVMASRIRADELGSLVQEATDFRWCAMVFVGIRWCPEAGSNR